MGGSGRRGGDGESPGVKKGCRRDAKGDREVEKGSRRDEKGTCGGEKGSQRTPQTARYEVGQNSALSVSLESFLTQSKPFKISCPQSPLKYRQTQGII